MERPIMDIPDKEKKKYFKIQASSASPATSAYSAQYVKRRKTRDAQDEIRERQARKEKGRIRRSRVLTSPFVGGLLKREQARGLRSEGLDSANIFATGLVPQGGLNTIPNFKDSGLFDIDHRPDLGDSFSDIYIAYDDHLLTYKINADYHNRSTRYGSIEVCHINYKDAIDCESSRLERFGDPGPSTSLSMHQETRRLATTWLSGSPRSGIAVVPMAGLSVGDEFETNRPTILVSPGESRGADVNTYSSAPAPPLSPLLFAFGTSHGILSLDKRDFDTKWQSPMPIASENHPKDIFALEFLSDNHSVLLSGGRAGILNITDLRVPKFGSLNADIINHPSSITNIRQLDSHRILVSGLNSNLLQYDLRFRKSDTPSSLQKVRKKQNLQSFRNLRATRPILSYEAYQNTATIQMGLDVDLESGVVVAGQEGDESHPRVQLFSLHGGQVLHRSVLGRCWDNNDYDSLPRPKCVKFAKDLEGRMKSLYVGNSDITRYAWVPREDGCHDLQR